VTPPYSTNFTNTDQIQTGHLLAKWTHDGLNGKQTSIQGYYDLISYPYTNQGSTAAMYDLNLEQRMGPKHGQDIAFGGGYRYMLNGGIPGPSAVLMPSSRRDTIVNFFGQDIIDLSKKDSLTVGQRLSITTSPAMNSNRTSAMPIFLTIRRPFGRRLGKQAATRAKVNSTCSRSIR